MESRYHAQIKLGIAEFLIERGCNSQPKKVIGLPLKLFNKNIPLARPYNVLKLNVVKLAAFKIFKLSGLAFEFFLCCFAV